MELLISDPVVEAVSRVFGGMLYTVGFTAELTCSLSNEAPRIKLICWGSSPAFDSAGSLNPTGIFDEGGYFGVCGIFMNPSSSLTSSPVGIPLSTKKNHHLESCRALNG
jgi:hypothetical protein